MNSPPTDPDDVDYAYLYFKVFRMILLDIWIELFLKNVKEAKYGESF